jgi:hypothetical protein
MRLFTIFLSIALLGNATAQTFELYDDFSGSALDTQKWETWYWPGGQAPVVTNGQLKLENGGGRGRKEAAFMSTLQSAGFDFSSGTYHSGVAFTDPSIIGVEADLYLPAGVAAESGVTIDLFEQVSSQEIRNAGVELGYWGGNQAELWFAKSAYTSGTQTSVVEVTEFVSLGQSYRVRILRQNGVIELYWDDVLIQTHAAEGELLALFIATFNDAGQAMYATVDNVRVLRDAPQEARWEPAGWVYYAWPYAYDFTQGRWHFFNQSNKQWRVNLSDGEWATLATATATGWNYYAWPYSYSSDQSTWHWYDANIQWVVDLASGEWELFGGSD